jgi:hypothetical protein
MQKQEMHINSLQQQLREQKRETANRSKQAQKERKQREQSERMLESLGALHLTPGTANALKTLFSSKKGAEMQESLQYLESKKPTVQRKMNAIRAKKIAEAYAVGISHARTVMQRETLSAAAMMQFGTAVSQSAFQKMLTAQRSMTKREIATAKEAEAAKPKFPKNARLKPLSLEEEGKRRELANLVYAWLDARDIDWDSGRHHSAVLPGLSFIGLEWIYRVGDKVQFGGDRQGTISQCYEDDSCCDIEFEVGDKELEVPVSEIISLEVPLSKWLTRDGTHPGRGIDYAHVAPVSKRLRCTLQSTASPKLVESSGELVGSNLYQRGKNIRGVFLNDPDAHLEAMGPDHPFLKRVSCAEAAEAAEGAEGGEVRGRLKDRVVEGVKLGFHCAAVAIRNEARRNLLENEWRGEYLRGNGKQVPSPNEDEESVYRLRKENGKGLMTLEEAKTEPALVYDPVADLRQFGKLYCGEVRDNGQYGGFRATTKSKLEANSMQANLTELRRWATRGTGDGMVVLGKHRDGHDLVCTNEHDREYVVDVLHRVQNTVNLQIWMDGATFCGERSWELTTKAVCFEPLQWNQTGAALTMIRQQVTDKPAILALMQSRSTTEHCRRVARLAYSLLEPLEGGVEVPIWCSNPSEDELQTLRLFAAVLAMASDKAAQGPQVGKGVGGTFYPDCKQYIARHEFRRPILRACKEMCSLAKTVQRVSKGVRGRNGISYDVNNMKHAAMENDLRSRGAIENFVEKLTNAVMRPMLRDILGGDKALPAVLSLNSVEEALAQLQKLVFKNARLFDDGLHDFKGLFKVLMALIHLYSPKSVRESIAAGLKSIGEGGRKAQKGRDVRKVGAAYAIVYADCTKNHRTIIKILTMLSTSRQRNAKQNT